MNRGRNQENIFHVQRYYSDFLKSLKVVSGQFEAVIHAYCLMTNHQPPLKQSEIWSIRTRLELRNSTRDLALFNLAIDSKLRGSDLTKLLVSDVSNGSHILRRTMVIQQKTSEPVQFELTQQTRDSVFEWIKEEKLTQDDYLFTSRKHDSNSIFYSLISIRGYLCFLQTKEIHHEYFFFHIYNTSSLE